VKFNRTNMFSTCLGVAGKNFESSKHVDLEIITNEFFLPKFLDLPRRVQELCIASVTNNCTTES
jgi:hypothetical protein